jgi:hypothetical protein
LLPLPFDLPFAGGFFAMASHLYNIMMKKTRGFSSAAQFIGVDLRRVSFFERPITEQGS